MMTPSRVSFGELAADRIEGVLRHMENILRRAFVFAITSTCLNLSLAGKPAGRPIDSARSVLRVRVFKTGLFSAFGHNHEVEAPIEWGEVIEDPSPSVELRVDARKIHVLDPEESEDTRAQIQKTMHGSQVLDADRFPEIHFRSTSVESKGTDRWLVGGSLNLHGQTHPVSVEVTLKDGLYRGSAKLKQTAFDHAGYSRWRNRQTER